MGHGIYVGTYSPGGKALLSTIPCSTSTADAETGDPYFNGGVSYTNVNLSALQAMVGTTTTWEAFRAAYRACFDDGSQAATVGYFPTPGGGTVDDQPAYWKTATALDGVYTDAMLDAIVADGLPDDSTSQAASLEDAGYTAMAKTYRLGLILLMGCARTSGGELDTVLGLSDDGDGTVVSGSGCNLIAPYLWVYLYDQANPPDLPQPSGPTADVDVNGFRSIRLARNNVTGVLNHYFLSLQEALTGFSDSTTTGSTVPLDANGERIIGLADAENAADLLPKAQAEGLV